MINVDAVQRIIGADAVDPDGSHLGTITEVYLDDNTGQPEWAVVSSGLFGTGSTYVPLSRAELMGDSLRLPFEKSVFASAPDLPGRQGHLSRADESELRRHYGLAPAPANGGLGTAADAPAEDPAASHDARGASMIRSEERLTTSTEWVPTERVRVRKVVVTEDVTVTVTVSHEELRVEREPILAEAAASSSAAPSPAGVPQVIVLHAERPVVSTEVVPTELVRLSTVTVSGSETVTGTVRLERIEASTDAPTGPGAADGRSSVDQSY